MIIVPDRCQERLLMGIFRRKFIWSNLQVMLLRETKVCRLKKVIYGLKQSPRAWFEKFSLAIYGIGFRRYHSDHSVFVRRKRSGIVVLTVYVDDILLTGSDSAGIVETCDQGHVTPKILSGNWNCILKIQYTFSQRKYAPNLLEETGFLGCKPANTQMEANMDLWFDDNHTW